MKDFKYWLRLPWPITELDREDSAQISRNLEQFLHFCKFLAKKTGFSDLFAMPHGARFFYRPPNLKNSAFLDFHAKLHLSTYGKEIWAGFEPSKGQKTLKK